MPELRDEVTRRDIVLHHVNQIRDHLAHVPNSREKSLVLTKLEEAELWLTQVIADEADQPAFGGGVAKAESPPSDHGRELRCGADGVCCLPRGHHGPHDTDDPRTFIPRWPDIQENPRSEPRV